MCFLAVHFHALSKSSAERSVYMDYPYKAGISITMLQGSPEQAKELAEEAKFVYSENTGDTAPDESE